MSRRLPPRKRALYRTVSLRARKQVYKRARYEVQKNFKVEKAMLVAAAHLTPDAVRPVLKEAHKAADWRGTLLRLHYNAWTEGAKVVHEVLGAPPNPKTKAVPLLWGQMNPRYGYVVIDERSKSIVATTDKVIEKVVANGVGEGLTKEEIAQNIGAVYDKWIDGQRSQTIAVTESTGPFGGGANEEVKDTGIAKYKVWCCIFVNSREWHMDADGQTVPIDDMFTVMDEYMMEPGDSSTPENVDNCQCWVDYTDEP